MKTTTRRRRAPVNEGSYPALLVRIERAKAREALALLARLLRGEVSTAPIAITVRP